MKVQLSLIVAAILISGCSTALKNPWRDVQAPAAGMPESFGFYSAGCVRGAQSLYPDGKGYRVMRTSRRRFYGHPNLIGYITDLGIAVNKRKLGALLIGDVGQARGGPTLSGHASHQNGLDVDIWYMDASDTSLTLDSRENFDAQLWSPANSKRGAEILKLATRSAEVDRIFVNPMIKRELCQRWSGKPNLAPALRRLRPWWGHDDHFHVRLRCPAGNVQCKPQEAVAEGDGCDQTLDWWFTPEAIAEAKKKKDEPESTKMPQLPEACAGVLGL